MLVLLLLLLCCSALAPIRLRARMPLLQLAPAALARRLDHLEAHLQAEQAVAQLGKTTLMLRVIALARLQPERREPLARLQALLDSHATEMRRLVRGLLDDEVEAHSMRSHSLPDLALFHVEQDAELARLTTAPERRALRRLLARFRALREWDDAKHAALAALAARLRELDAARWTVRRFEERGADAPALQRVLARLELLSGDAALLSTIVAYRRATDLERPALLRRLHVLWLKEVAEGDAA